MNTALLIASLTTYEVANVDQYHGIFIHTTPLSTYGVLGQIKQINIDANLTYLRRARCELMPWLNIIDYPTE